MASRPASLSKFYPSKEEYQKSGKPLSAFLADWWKSNPFNSKCVQWFERTSKAKLYEVALQLAAARASCGYEEALENGEAEKTLHRELELLKEQGLL